MTTRRRIAWLALAVLIGVFAVSAAGLGSSRSAAADSSDHSTPAGTALQDAFVKVLGRVRSSVVEISTAEGLGSGVIYNQQGDIVTNAHVVGSASNLHVTLADGRTLPGTIVGICQPDDLAVVRISGGPMRPAAFGDSSEVRVGDIVLAIGNPLGLSSTVTDGIVSATGRTVSEENGVVLPSTIQTSADINPGNSGGALVDLDGQVIGIPTLAATDPQLGGGSAPGIGFAISSNTVKLIADQLISTGTVSNSDRAALGIKGVAATTSTGQPVGVLVREARAPASDVGISAGDIIVGLHGRSTLTLGDLHTQLAELAPGERAAVRVLHPNGTKHSYTLVLGELEGPKQ